jgi:hypothetical protein
LEIIMNNVLNTVIVIGVLGLVFFLLNTILLAVIFFMRRKMAAVSQWPSTGGVVLASMLESRSDSEGGYTNYPVVKYAYQVGTQNYQSRTIAPGPEIGGSGAGKVISRYPINTLVTVYYNPQNPSDAVLEKKAPAQSLMWLLLIVFDIVLCCVAPIGVWAASMQ